MQKSKPNRAVRNKSESTQVKTFLQIQLFAVIIYIIVFLIGSFVALSADISGRLDYLISLIIFAVSSFSAGFFTGIKIRQKGLLTAIIYSLPINISVIIISLFINDFSFNFNALISLSVLTAFAGIGGILAVNKRLRR